eukprot:1307242-Rhodomonas_salina.3
MAGKRKYLSVTLETPSSVAYRSRDPTQFVAELKPLLPGSWQKDQLASPRLLLSSHPKLNLAENPTGTHACLLTNTRFATLLPGAPHLSGFAGE